MTFRCHEPAHGSLAPDQRPFTLASRSHTSVCAPIHRIRSDEELLGRMGWTRNRAVQVLGQLEDEGFLRSYSDRGPRGGNVKMYSITPRAEPEWS